MLDLPPEPTIVVTASRVTDAKDETPASVTLIEAPRIERLGAPLVTDLLRLAPSLAVSVSGPAGSLTDVRIRGAEANHSLLFVEGIRANDPAAGNVPRFELLNADLASRIEVVRGPQSALWGSEAIGGVVAVTGPEAGSGGSMLDLEAGSFGTRRGAARTSIGTADRGLSFGIAGQRSDGIDSFSGSGDRDGYRNLSGRVAGTYRLGDRLALSASGFASRGLSEFDGYDPNTFLHSDTADRTRNRIAAARVKATYGDMERTYLAGSASLLGSHNRNEVDWNEINRTRASRRTVAIEAGHRIGRHRFVAAVESEGERFHSRDLVYGGATDQDRSRAHHSLTLEWKMTDLGRLSTDLAVRRDIFSRFEDATTVRGSALLKLGRGLSLAANYGEGIAQPTFFDLYGFFPGSFTGNPSLRPEKSKGGELSLRYAQGATSAALTYYRQRLRGEILDVFAFPLSTTANGEGASRRQGVELELGYQPSEAFHLSAAYSYLGASEPRGPGGAQVKEQRRPKHGGSVAVDGQRGRFTYGASIAFTGAHLDTDFDVYPARRVRLDSYWLAGARLAYRVSPAVELHLRVANAFDDAYQDVLGYRTEGRSVHGGIRFALGR
jgi:vitamin B12 transporter